MFGINSMLVAMREGASRPVGGMGEREETSQPALRRSPIIGGQREFVK